MINKDLFWKWQFCLIRYKYCQKKAKISVYCWGLFLDLMLSKSAGISICCRDCSQAYYFNIVLTLYSTFVERKIFYLSSPTSIIGFFMTLLLTLLEQIFTLIFTLLNLDCNQLCSKMAIKSNSVQNLKTDSSENAQPFVTQKVSKEALWTGLRMSTSYQSLDYCWEIILKVKFNFELCFEIVSY